MLASSQGSSPLTGSLEDQQQEVVFLDALLNNPASVFHPRYQNTFALLRAYRREHWRTFTPEVAAIFLRLKNRVLNFNHIFQVNGGVITTVHYLLFSGLLAKAATELYRVEGSDSRHLPVLLGWLQSWSINPDAPFDFLPQDVHPFAVDNFRAGSPAFLFRRYRRLNQERFIPVQRDQPNGPVLNVEPPPNSPSPPPLVLAPPPQPAVNVQQIEAILGRCRGYLDAAEGDQALTRYVNAAESCYRQVTTDFRDTPFFNDFLRVFQRLLRAPREPAAQREFRLLMGSREIKRGAVLDSIYLVVMIISILALFFLVIHLLKPFLGLSSANASFLIVFSTLVSILSGLGTLYGRSLQKSARAMATFLREVERVDGELANVIAVIAILGDIEMGLVDEPRDGNAERDERRAIIEREEADLAAPPAVDANVLASLPRQVRREDSHGDEAEEDDGNEAGEASERESEREEHDEIEEGAARSCSSSQPGQ